MPGTQQAGKEGISGTCDSISEGCLWKAWKTTVFMAEQLVTIDDRQILMKAGHIPEQSDVMQKINDLLKRQLGLGE